jgi:hypothetical protein
MRLLADTIIKQNIDRDTLTVHADNRSSMASKPVAFLRPPGRPLTPGLVQGKRADVLTGACQRNPGAVRMSQPTPSQPRCGSETTKIRAKNPSTQESPRTLPQGS